MGAAAARSARWLGGLGVGAYVAAAAVGFVFFYPILAAHPISWNAWHAADVVPHLDYRAGLAKDAASPMSGHSKWHNIKLKKGKVDAQRGALFTKLSKEIILAAKGGSPDPEANYRLKMAVEKAREFNMPQENIKRAIARSSGQSGEREIEEIRYEGYGPHGLGGRRRRGDRQSQSHRRRAALPVQPARRQPGRERQRRLDVRPRRRSSSSTRPGNPKTRSRRRRSSTASRTSSTTTIWPSSTRSRRAWRACATRCAQRGVKISDAYLGMRAKTKLELQGDELSAALAFLEALEEHEDVQRVFSNLDFSRVPAEALA